jgi:predicted Fe-Mo cluster-binding NifX family protein
VIIAIATNGPDLDAEVENRFGLSPYLLIIDVDTLDFEAVPVLSDNAGRGAGIGSVAIAIENKAKAIIAGYISPNVAKPLLEHDIEVFTSVNGKVRDVVERYRRGELGVPVNENKTTAKENLLRSVNRTARQFASILPVLIGVVFLIGLFQAFVSKEILFSLFSGKHLSDAITGAFFGSLFTGNPINSYVIGNALLKLDVSLYAVTALIVTWVTVGIIQLPAEISVLGWRFALSRNLTAFILAVPVAFLTVYVLRLLE